jgi:hypothetical protein
VFTCEVDWDRRTGIVADLRVLEGVTDPSLEDIDLDSGYIPGEGIVLEGSILDSSYIPKEGAVPEGCNLDSGSTIAIASATAIDFADFADSADSAASGILELEHGPSATTD